MALIALASVTYTAHHIFCYLPPYSEAPGHGVHGLAQPFHNAQTNAVEQHGLAVLGGNNQLTGGQPYPSQTQHQPRFEWRATREHNNMWSIRGMRDQPFGLTDDDQSSLSDLQLRHDPPAMRRWQAILAQAPDTLFSHAQGTTRDTDYATGRTKVGSNTHSRSRNWTSAMTPCSGQHKLS